MGFLRILLALSVLVVHANFRHGSMELIPADLAVEIFYIISGYYMAMILSLKYQNVIKAFFINRATKIYSIYFVALLFAFLVKLIIAYRHQLPVFDIGMYPMLAQVWIVFSNIFIVGLDWQMFATIVNHHIVFSENFRSAPFEFARMMLLPQAWSISLELYFYLLIPFIVRRNLILMVLFIGSFLIKIILFYYGYSFDPWSYRFFPAELWLFLLGTMAFKYRDILNKIPKSLIAIYFIALVLCPGKNQDNYQYFFIYLLSFLIIPKLFTLSKNSKWDRFIGELSYPFYLIHSTVLMLFSSQPINNFAELLFIIGLVFVLSFAIERFFYVRVQRFRLATLKHFKKETKNAEPIQDVVGPALLPVLLPSD
jgi:peptidoglycan/LPS O-acetylase OafA/YrhL